ncbi:MAG: hypothetical protein WB767_17820 [Nocardioides sp.]
MSQTAAQPAPPASSPTTAVAPVGPATSLVTSPATSPAMSGQRDLAEDVPSLLNRLQVLAVVACLVFGVVSAAIQVVSWHANGRAADNTEQVVRVQQIQSLLLRADAIATNAFLIGGLEPPAARAEYDAATDDVLRLVADAAEAQPADRKVLADLNVEVRNYTTAVAQARDYNRQNFPIGIAYLNNAGDSLRSQALPMVQALVDANSQRAVDEMEGQHPIWLFWLGVLCLLGLWWVNRQLAKRFHRRFNVGVSVGAAVLIVLTLLTAVHAFGRSSDNDETRDGPYQSAVDEASARTAANDAKAQESQGLINRGSGAVYEENWRAAAEVVEESASPRTLRLWTTYVGLHTRVRDLDDGGQWDRAVTLATSAAPDGPTATLDEVDVSAEQVVGESAAEATDGFRSGGFTSLLLVVLTLLGALVAAAAATWGINQRRREYS